MASRIATQIKPLARSKPKLASEKLKNAFIDVVRTKIQAGRGGCGMVHFAREAFRPVAPPDGGDGGTGGNILLEVLHPGMDLRRVDHSYTAGDGGKGTKARGRGEMGKDVILRIPQGCVITEYIPPVPPRQWMSVFPQYETAEDATVVLNDNQLYEEFKRSWPKKLPHPPLNIDTSNMPVGTQLKIALGGLGGRGNFHFQSSTNRSPMEYTEGQAGQLRYLHIELKLLADVGLVGMPNSGKSSFVRSVSRCKSAVAGYEFTTVKPHIGTIQFDAQRIPIEGEQTRVEKQGENVTHIKANFRIRPPFSLTVADIPGIIKGASENRGLGHEFMRHIEKSSLLAYVLDLSKDPVEDLKVLIDEVEKYQSGMALGRNGLILANKADLQAEGSCQVVQDNYKELEAYVSDLQAQLPSGKQWHVVPISAKFGLNVEKAIELMRKIIDPNYDILQ